MKTIEKKKLKEAEIIEKLLWQELEVLAKFDHPNIVRALDFLEDDERIYIIFELMKSGDLEKNIVTIKNSLPTTSKNALEAAVANLVY